MGENSVSWSGLVVLSLLVLGGCVEVHQLMPATDRLPGAKLAGEGPLEESYVGLELEEALLGSLEELDYLSGLRVVKVAKGSPADAAGVQRDDLLIEAAGQKMEKRDQWTAILQAAGPGSKLLVVIERDTGLVDVELEVALTRSGELGAPTRWSEVRKARLVAETVLDEGGQTVARIEELLPGSPLIDADVHAGEEIVRLDGVAVYSASDLVARFSQRSFGESVELSIAGSDGIRDVKVKLWSPPREVTRMCLPIVFDYKADLVEDSQSFSFIDLWLLALFDYEREGETRRYRILRFIQFESGVGELTEMDASESGGEG